MIDQFHSGSGEGIGIVVHKTHKSATLDPKETSSHHGQSSSRLLTHAVHRIRRRIRANETCTRGKLAHPFETPISPHHRAHSHTHTHAHTLTTAEEGRGFAVILGIKRSRRQWGVLVSIPGKGTCAGHGTHLAPRSPPRFLVADDLLRRRGRRQREEDEGR